MEIKKVAILGAGAVGSYVIEGISGCREIRLGVIAEGERNARLKSAGCTINGVTYHPEVWTYQETDNIDLLIVSLKYGALPTALDTIKQATSQNTIVMSLMNGVDSEEIIGAKIGMSHILPALIKVASHKEPDGYHFDRKSTIGIIFGEYKSPFQSERVKAVCDLFEKSDISYRDSVHMKAISEGLRSEIEAIAAAKGIEFSKIESSAKGSPVMPSARYSTLQDLDAKRHTEIDMFSGALMRMGKELGIPTPYNEYTYHMIKALEEKNDGLFDYKGKDETPTYSK